MNNTFNTELGKLLHSMRQERGISQQSVADRMGMSRSTVSYWEVGKREILMTDFIKFCDICNEDPYKTLEKVRKYVYR